MATTKRSSTATTGKKSPGRPPKQTGKSATNSSRSQSTSKTSARASSSTASKSHSTRGRKSSSATSSTTMSKAKSNSAQGSAHQSFKMQAAREVGVSLKQGDNGHLTARQAGQIGGQMVKKMVQSYSNKTSK